MFLKVMLSYSLLFSPLMAYATEDITEYVSFEKTVSPKEKITIEQELRQLIQDVSFVNNYNLFVSVTSSLSIAMILVGIVLLKLDIEAIRRAVV